ncbi:MAG: hypothetical protein NTX53_10345 [candidate division WOR-3 bacterium]|nr:hypothetical protein [candidate division WOR-3 bacterium]
MLASALVIAAAAASLFGPEPVQRLVGSAWFLAAAGVVAATSLLAAVVAIRRRSWPGAIQHLGLVIALGGVVVNQTTARNGYLFLEQRAGAGNVFLSRDLRRAEELPEPLALDSVGSVLARAFRPAPVAWVTVKARGEMSKAVTYNRPLKAAGWQFLLTQTVEPGFLNEYELAVDGEEYLLMHNQVIEPAPGLHVWSFTYDVDARRVGLMFGSEQQWLGIGDSATLQGRTVKLTSATFAADSGVIFVVNDARFRFIIFAGFGLMLLGLVLSLFRREEQ